MSSVGFIHLHLGYMHFRLVFDLDETKIPCVERRMWFEGDCTKRNHLHLAKT